MAAACAFLVSACARLLRFFFAFLRLAPLFSFSIKIRPTGRIARARMQNILHALTLSRSPSSFLASNACIGKGRRGRNANSNTAPGSEIHRRAEPVLGSPVHAFTRRGLLVGDRFPPASLCRRRGRRAQISSAGSSLRHIEARSGRMAHTSPAFSEGRKKSASLDARTPCFLSASAQNLRNVRSTSTSRF